MAGRPRKEPPEDVTPPRPATTPLGREQQLVAAAVDLAEKQILNGTASSQVLVHYLKLGSSREHLEQQKIQQENSLTAAKIEAMAAATRVEELYTEAIKVMRAYQGVEEPLEMPADDGEDYD